MVNELRVRTGLMEALHPFLALQTTKLEYAQLTSENDFLVTYISADLHKFWKVKIKKMHNLTSIWIQANLFHFME